MDIRLASERDAAQLLSIYRPIVESSPASFELSVPTGPEFARRIARTLQEWPWLVAHPSGAPDEVLGYAYASAHRAREAYRWSAEVSVYVDPSAHRRGAGRKLYCALFSLLRAQGYRSALAGIVLPNEPSVRLHESLGFERIGVYRAVGFKLGAWWDTGWWGLQLQELAQPAAPTPLRALAPELIELGLRGD